MFQLSPRPLESSRPLEDSPIAVSASSGLVPGIMEPPGDLASEWNGGNLLRLFLGLICFALAWPYAVRLVDALRGALNRATSEERERESELKALLERYDDMIAAEHDSNSKICFKFS